MDDSSPLTPEELTELRGELEAELRRLERSMLVTDEGLKPVEVDAGTTGRLSRMDELRNQAMTRNLREREAMSCRTQGAPSAEVIRRALERGAE